MKKCYLDSNFLVYIKNESSLYHKEALKLISKLVLKNVELLISPLGIDEFLHSFLRELKQKQMKNPFEDLKKAFNDILELPELHIVNPPVEVEAQRKVINYMQKYQLRARDAYHLITIESNNLDSFATFDNDFKKVFAEKIIEKA